MDELRRVSDAWLAMKQGDEKAFALGHFDPDYLANFDPRIEALVPTPDELQQVAKAYRAYYAKVKTSDGGYTMDHTATVYLMNGKGQLQSTIAFGEAAETRKAKLEKLLAEG